MADYYSIIKAKNFKESKFEIVDITVPVEKKIEIFINDKKFVNIMCTPIDVEELIIGFLFCEEIISDVKNIKKIRFEENYKVNIHLVNEIEVSNNDKTFTSGFGKGVTFKTEGKKVISNFKISANSILVLMDNFKNSMNIYKTSGAVHASCIADENSIIAVKEDIGRHNTFDKIAGYCLKNGISTKDKIIITTGRISSEMILKCSKMGIPIAITMKSPTSYTLDLANKLGVTVIGRVKLENSSFLLFEDGMNRVDI